MKAGIGRAAPAIAMGFWLAAGCAVDGERVETVSQASLAPVTWINAVGVAAAGNDLTKTGGNGWNAGAISSQAIAGDGAVEFTTGENTMAKAVGLSFGDGGQSYVDIDFALYLTAGGAVRIYEAGVLKASAGTYAAGDAFRVEVSGGVVTYRRNGALLYTSAVAPSFPLVVDTSLNQTGATIQDVMFGDTVWQNAVNVAVAGHDLVNTGTSGWVAGAASLATILSDGAVEFSTLESTKGKAAGLSSGDSGQSYTDIDFCILLTATGGVKIYEGGVLRGTFGTYVPGDVFRVETVAGVVRYRKNGVYLYTSLVAPSFPLLADTSLNQTGATLEDVALRSTFWQNASGVALSGHTLTKTGAAGWNAGASTIPTVSSAGGQVEFTATEATTAKSGGLSNGDSNHGYKDIDFAFNLTAGGRARIYEGGVLKASAGTYGVGTTFRVEVAGGVVTYRKNGNLVYTSSVAPVFPLRFDSSLYDTGAVIANVQLVRSGPECDAVTQDGCVGGQKCGWLQLSDTSGQTACVPAGPVGVLGACSFGAPGPTTGYDDCASGTACAGGRCQTICSMSPDSCDSEFKCLLYADLFTDDPTGDVGTCDPRCDVIAQDCPEGDSCNVLVFSGDEICTEIPPGAELLTQNQECLNNGTSCYMNGCAEGYGPYIFVSDGQPRLCTAYCSPVNTYLDDPDGDGVGPLVAGADADGTAPADCSLARTGVAGLQCRFLQSAGAPSVAADVGYCAPVNAVYGDCNQTSEERLIAIYDQAVTNGQDGDQAVQTFCAANPAVCGVSCFDLAHRAAIHAAYCSSHPGSSACSP